jgi:rhodanese-related sulfurtransferase
VKKMLVMTVAALCAAGFLAGTAAAVEDVAPRQAHRMIRENRDNPDFVILDVRTPEEFEDGRLEGAVNIDYYAEDFRDRIDRLQREDTYLIYCRSGARSSSAYRMMEEMGFERMYNLRGGILEWKSRGLPLVR